MAVSFAAYFDSQHLSDAEVRFVDAGSGGSCLLASIPSHQLVLKNASERWTAELERWQQQESANSDSGGGGVGKAAVSVALAGAHEVPLGRTLLRLLYTGELAESGNGGECGSSESALLRLLELAHCSLLTGAMRVVCSALSALAAGGGGLSWSAVETLLAAPDDLAELAEFQPLSQHLEEAVFKRLGDLEVALDDDSSTAALQRLPAASLARLLSSSALRVGSECSVVAAVGAWVAARGGAGCVRPEVCLQLLRCVRIAQLPLSYCLGALLRQTWVIRSEADMHVMQAISLLALPEAMAPLREMQLSATSAAFRALWRLWAGKGPRQPSARPKLSLDAPALGEAQLRAMFEAAQLQLGRRPPEGAPAPGAPQRQAGASSGKKRGAGGAGMAGARKRGRRQGQQPLQQELQQEQEGAAGEESGLGDSAVCAEGSAEAAQVSFWGGFFWRTALRWAPVSSRGSAPPQLQLQLTVTARHAWCKRGVPLRLLGVSSAVKSYKRQPGAAASVAAGSAAQSQGQGSSSKGPARVAGVYQLRAPQNLWASGDGAAPGSRQAGPAEAARLVFGKCVPVAVSEWVCDWEGVEGMPLGLAEYMRGGSLRLAVEAEAFE